MTSRIATEMMFCLDDNRVILKQHNITHLPLQDTSMQALSQTGGIATQGPIEETSKDFWEMILQNRCLAVVMLTPLRDHNGVDKCGDYLQLEDGGSEFRDISIVTRWKQTRESSLILRCIEVKRKKSEELPFSVLHILYLDWPDHGVSNDTVAVRDIFRITSAIPASLGPIVVHSMLVSVVELGRIVSCTTLFNEFLPGVVGRFTRPREALATSSDPLQDRATEISCFKRR
ncbi:tyrosine protein phosphatase 1 [Orobanche minor]